MPPKSNTLSDYSLPIEHFLQSGSVIFYQCSLEEDYPINKISPNVQDILGYYPKDFYESSTFWMQQIHAEFKADVEKSFSNIIDEMQHTFVYRFQHGDGHYIWLRDENVVILDDKGNPKAISGTAIDITRQKQAEEKVRLLNQTLEQRIKERTHNLTVTNRKIKKQMQYRDKVEKQVYEQQQQLKLLQVAINHINDMIIITKGPVDDPLDSEIVFTNKAFEKLTGYKLSEVKGKSPNFLHGEKTQPDRLNKLERSITNHEQVRLEFINYKKDGTFFWVDLEMSPLPAQEEDMVYWVGINRDITDRKRTEKVLAENEERYRTYAELSFDAIFEIDLDGHIIDCNAKACQLFGYTRKEFLGMNVWELSPEKNEDNLPDYLKPDETPISNVVQQTYVTKEGATFTSEVNTKLYNRDDENHIIAYIRDISEHIEYEKEIEKSLREKSTLLAEVHHRVKNNLAVIAGLLEMQTFNADNEQVMRALQESQSRIQSIATVHEMLYQSDSFSDIRLEKYIDELVSFISNTFAHDEADIRFNKNIAPISLTVKQAVPCGLLLNELITNAYKHAFKGLNKGTIFISLRQEDDQTVHLEVGDNGIGLPEKIDIENASTLGLSLIHTLVQQLNGSLEIQRTPSTQFNISFQLGEETSKR